MRRQSAFWLWILGISVICSGCQYVGGIGSDLSIVYAVAAVLSFVLLVGYVYWMPRINGWFIVLFLSVFVVNCGYLLLSISANLEAALWANRIAYLGSVFLPMSMLVIILDVTKTTYKKWVVGLMISVGVLVFGIAASPGILKIYYEDVTFTVVDGAGVLVKEYGPLHFIYLVYLVGYLGNMVAVILRASAKKTVENTSHAVILTIAVFVNIGVWLIEQFVDIKFEILSISYIISELFLLGVHLIVLENQRLRNLVQQKEEELPKESLTENVSKESIKQFLSGLESLTPTEQKVYEMYISGSTTKDVLETLNIKENTLKFHNKNLYSKLGVSSRRQLIEIYKTIHKEK